MDATVRELTLDYQPLAIYRDFHASPQRERLLVGGMGTGKTFALCGDALARGLRMPGAKILVTRRTVPELRDTLEPEFLRTMGGELLLASTVRRAGGHIESIVLPNGTVYLFRSLDDWHKLRSTNLALWYCDEITELDRETFNGVRSRTRQVELTEEATRMGYTHKIPAWFRGVVAATNPNGHDWVWNHWVDRPEDEQDYWVATSLDNPHLPMDYLNTLLSMPKAFVKRYVFGSFDEFSGRVYPEWSRDTHVIPPAVMARTMPIWMGYDPGTRHPAGCLWVAHTNGKLIAVREELHQGWTVKQWVARMREVETKLPPVQWRVGDPNSLHVKDRGIQVSLHRQFARQGIHIQNGPSRQPDRLPMLGTLVAERRFLATSDCPLFIQQMETYRWEELSAAMKRRLGDHAEDYGPEKPVKANDDLIDPAQYLSSRLVKKPQLDRPKTEEVLTDWQLQSRELTRKNKRRRPGMVHSTSDINVPV